MSMRNLCRTAAVLPALVLALALGMSGCESFNLSGMLKNPEVSVSGAEIEQLAFDGARVRFDVKVSNPNPVGVRLAGFDYRLTLDGTEFLTGTVDQAVSIAARGASTIPVPVAFRYENLLAAVARLAEAAETPYEMAVGFSFELPVLGKVRVPASFKGVLPVLRAPGVSVAALRLDRLTLTAASLVLSLDIRNPNDFSLGLQGLDYSFAVGEAVGAGQGGKGGGCPRARDGAPRAADHPRPGGGGPHGRRAARTAGARQLRDGRKRRRSARLFPF